jgi:hypothetical protein
MVLTLVVVSWLTGFRIGDETTTSVVVDLAHTGGGLRVRRLS